ncbi:MAG: DICT sensory domain-containing protein [Cyanobacteria bacterium P01_A01_bin.84]
MKTKTSNSLLDNLLESLPQLRSQVYFKASLKALSHAMEDLVLKGDDQPLVIVNFHQQHFSSQGSRRYQRMAGITDQVYVMTPQGANISNNCGLHSAIAYDENDDLAQDWHLVIFGKQYCACIFCREFASPIEAISIDRARQFEGIWTFERQVCAQAANLLLERILDYRPDLASRVEVTRKIYGLTQRLNNSLVESNHNGNNFNKGVAQRIRPIDAHQLFTARLVNYLQSSQYRQLKAYRNLFNKERLERLTNKITAFIRNSLDPNEIFQTAVREIGQIFSPCRCIIYPDDPSEITPLIEYEWIADDSLASLKGESWQIVSYPLIEEALKVSETIIISDTKQDLGIKTNPQLGNLFAEWEIRSFLLIPIRYQETLVGILEIHHCGEKPYTWSDSEQLFIKAIANQVGVAIMQAQTYSNLEVVNRQLANLERTQSNLIAIVGHELRTPLSTIQICLESLAEEENIPIDLQQSMLQTALEDSERMRRLIQDFLTLSKLEGNGVRWQIESTSLQDTLDLVLSSIQGRKTINHLPKIIQKIPAKLPLVQVDREGLTEVLNKLIDNACKFTSNDGKVTITAKVMKSSAPKKQFPKKSKAHQMLEVIITDTGRGIETNQLETIFQCFYQEEGFLRRSIGGTGLGLAICRQIIQKLGGEIWAVSQGKNQGSEFHFTLPIA